MKTYFVEVTHPNSIYGIMYQWSFNFIYDSKPQTEPNASLLFINPLTPIVTKKEFLLTISIQYQSDK